MAIDRIPGVGPLNSDIATAVAAPSAATIATAVAAAVPTLAQINTSVATNAPNPSDWTLIGNSGTGWNTFTFSSITGYKRLRLLMPKAFGSANGPINLRINGNSTAGDYVTTRVNVDAAAINGQVSGTQTSIQMSMNISVDAPGSFDLIFDFANSTTLPKTITGRFGSAVSPTTSSADSFRGYFIPTAAITSLTIFLSGALTLSGLPVYLLGQN